MSGHLAMFHTSTAVEPRPTALPTASAAGPVSTSASATAAVSSRATRVIRIIQGRSFQNGLPSRIS
jgi:hypothetical protein